MTCKILLSSLWFLTFNGALADLQCEKSTVILPVNIEGRTSCAFLTGNSRSVLSDLKGTI